MVSLHPFAKPEYAVNWLRERADINRKYAHIPPEQWEARVLPYIADRLDAAADMIEKLAREIANLRSDIAQLRGELSLAEEGLASFAQSAGEPEALHLVCCSKCSDQMRLPYTDASRTSVSLFQAGGWYFSTETGWLCPKDAPQVKSREEP